MTEDIVSEQIHVLISLDHLGQMLCAYFKQMGLVKDKDIIKSLEIPVEVNSEGNVAVTIGVTVGTIN